jgi:hypothetical protein
VLGRGCGVPEDLPVSKIVTYSIDGNLDGKGWVQYATLGQVTESQAVEVFEGWQWSRDHSEWTIRYRLVRRFIEEEIVLSEEAET